MINKKSDTNQIVVIGGGSWGGALAAESEK